MPKASTPKSAIDVGDPDYESVMTGLEQARAILDGTAAPGSFKMHFRDIVDGESRPIEFPAMLTGGDGGAVLVTFRDVPEAITGGATEAEALANARDALQVALEGYILGGRELPSPSSAEASEILIALG